MQKIQKLKAHGESNTMLNEDIARQYIEDMLQELSLMAEASELQETAGLLNMTRLIMTLRPK